MLEHVTQEIKTMLTTAGITGEIELNTPPKSEMGDLAFPCFAVAKAKGANPAEVAKELAAALKPGGMVARVEAFGPYVNFFVDAGSLAKAVLTEIFTRNEAYGRLDLGQNKKVMIEYPSQNSHKEFHIGHLRNVCIGNTLVQLFRAAGYNVTPVNYINDFGAHVVKCLWGIQHFHKGEKPKENRQRWLGELYAEASAYIEDHPEVKPEVEALQVKLEARDPEIWPLFEETRAWSLEGFDKIQAELGCTHEAVFFESEVKDRGQQVVDELLEKGIAKVGDKGAVIIDLTEDKLDIALLRKATGAGLYLTSDLALAEQKFSSHDIAESINITGIEQNFYFKQLFRVLQRNGFNHKMTHIGYGLVTLPEGKMSSRKGNVILYEALRDDVYAYMEDEVAKRHTDWTEEKIDEVASLLTQAVLKFTMLKHEAAKNITFDFKEAVSFEGFSAPYLLYTVARINSILRKKNVSEARFDLLITPEEKIVVAKLAEFKNVVAKALGDYNPSVITNYTFELAQSFSTFYHKHSVLEAAGTDELCAARLRLAQATKHIIVQALNLLTIETVEEM